MKQSKGNWLILAVIITVFNTSLGQVLEHQWAAVWPKQGTNNKSEVLFAKQGYGSSMLMAQMSQWGSSISLSNFGVQQIMLVDQTGVIDSLLELGPRVNILSMTTGANAHYYLLRYTDSLHFGDTLLTVGQPWTPEEILIATDLANHNILWTTTAPYMNDMDLYNGTLSVLCGGFGESVLRTFDANTGSQKDSVHIASVLSGRLDLDTKGSAYISGLVSGYDTVKVGNFTQYMGGTGLHVCALKIDSLGNGRWIQSSTDMNYAIPHIICDHRGSVWLTGDLFGQQIWDSDTLEGSQWVYDFFLVRFDTSGTVLGAWETPNSPSITGDYHPAVRQPLAVTDSSVVLMLNNRGGVAFKGSLPVGATTDPQDHGITFLEYGSDYLRGLTFNAGYAYVLGSGVATVDNGYHALWAAGVSYCDTLQCSWQAVTMDSLYNDVLGLLRFDHIVGLPEIGYSTRSDYLYPNPTSGELNAQRTWAEGEHVQIRTLDGRLIFQGAPEQWSERGYDAGIYILVRRDGSTYRFVYNPLP